MMKMKKAPTSDGVYEVLVDGEVIGEVARINTTRTQSLWCAKPNGWEFDGNTMYIAHKTRYSALDNLMAFHHSYEWVGSQYIGREK